MDMKTLTEFVREHIGDDVTRLVMNRNKYPEIDMDLAVNCIESRRKLRGKVQEWYDEPGLIFPRKLSAEQCSSSATGRYKAALAERIAGQGRIADLTGGLGVDSWFFSQRASEVMYCEMLPELCKAAMHNFSVLESGNITVINAAVCDSGETSTLDPVGRSDKNNEPETSIFKSPTEILSGFNPDIVYMDPARRGEGGKKVFLIEECTPDVLTLKEEIFSISRHILIKLSPMADISMVCERLGTTCREVHVVAAGGECKELLVWMDREWNAEYSIHAVELDREGNCKTFSFIVSEEKIAGQAGNDGRRSIGDDGRRGIGDDGRRSIIKGEVGRMTGECHCEACQGRGNLHLFEPGKALMKAGAFNLIAERFGLHKLGHSTHYYIFNDPKKVEPLKGHGKVFGIIRCEPLDKRTIKAAGKEFPHSEVTARNIPLDTETLRKKMGITSGDDAHIFGLKSDSEGALLFITTPLR